MSLAFLNMGAVRALVHLSGGAAPSSVTHTPCFLRTQRRRQAEEAQAEGRVQEEEADQRAPLTDGLPAERLRAR